jgi:hypothetical protein
VQQSALERLADELGSVAGEIEREVKLRVDAALADIARREAERELRIVMLERRMEERLASLKDGDPGASVTVEECAPLIAEEVARQVAALPPAEPGRNVTIDEVRPLLQEMVDALPPAEPGKSVTVEECVPVIAEEVARQVSAIPPAEPGKSVTVDEVAPVIAAEVARQVAALPAPEPGKSVTVEDVEPLLREMVAAIEIPKGEPGAPGKLPAVKAWEDRVHYEGEVVAYDGATWQAAKDTGRAPPHEDWTCIARSGRDGEDGASFSIEGTFDPARVDYRRLSVVALNGASFVAVRDHPGACPGDGWQLLAMRGKAGKPGEDSRVKGDPGPAGPKVRALAVSDDGVMTLTNADGSTVELDLYPLLSKLQG